MAPVRMVFFDDLPRENASFQAWLARIGARARVVPPKEFVISPGKPGEAWLRERYVVLEIDSAAAIEARVGQSLSGLAEKR